MNDALVGLGFGLFIGVLGTTTCIANSEHSPSAVAQRAAEKHCQDVLNRHEYLECVEDFKK